MLLPAWVCKLGQRKLLVLLMVWLRGFGGSWSCSEWVCHLRLMWLPAPSAEAAWSAGRDPKYCCPGAPGWGAGLNSLTVSLLSGRKHMRTFFSKETVFSFNKRQTKSVIINHFISFLFVSTDLGVFYQPQLQVLGLISHFLYSEYVDLQKGVYVWIEMTSSPSKLYLLCGQLLSVLSLY